MDCLMAFLNRKKIMCRRIKVLVMEEKDAERKVKLKCSIKQNRKKNYE